MDVITIGTFDLFHAGHVKLLERCRKIAGKHGDLVIGVNTDDFVENYKGARPVMPQSSRAAALQAYGQVKFHDGDTPQWILDTSTELIVIGTDWIRKDYLGQLDIDQRWLEKHNISVMFVPYTAGISTTTLKSRREDERITRVVDARMEEIRKRIQHG